MDNGFQNINLVIPELLKDFEIIQNSATTTELTINAFAESFQKRLNLYSVIASQVNGDWLIFSSVFTSDKTLYENLTKYPPRPRKISSDLVLSRLVTDGQILISSLKSQKDYAPIFMETASNIWLPLKREMTVIGIIQLGSERIIETEKLNNTENAKSFRIPYEKLLDKISQVLEKEF